MDKVFLFLTILGALTSVKALTDCQEHRKRESNSNAPLPMRLIPECDDNGDYKPLQCFQNSKFCACWNKNGDPVTQPSGKIKACDCMVQKHEVEKKGLVGGFKPQCEEDGKFKKEQCHGSTGMCWCAHPVTGEKTTEPARGKPKCK